MDEFFARAKLVELRAQEVYEDFMRAIDGNDFARAQARAEEHSLLLRSIREIRAEQLTAYLERLKPAPKPKPWWERLRKRSADPRGAR